MESIRTFFEWVGAVVAVGGGLAAMVYQVFKHLAVKWLDARFEERLQALRHEQQKEIESLRGKISALLDRTVKLHQREFEVLPEAWARLNDAYWAIRQFVSPFQSYSDLDSMGDPQREQYINDSVLKDWQKDEVRAAENKTDTYRKAIYWHTRNAVNAKSAEAYSYLIKNGIFIGEDLRKQLTEVHDLMWNALTQHESNEDHNILPRNQDRINKFMETGDSLMKSTELAIHRRLWPSPEISPAT